MEMALTFLLSVCIYFDLSFTTVEYRRIVGRLIQSTTPKQSLSPDLVKLDHSSH